MSGKPTDRDEPTARNDPGGVEEGASNVMPPAAGGVDQVFSEVYEELRKLAHRYMDQQRPDHTLQATALTHEAYLRLQRRSTAGWSSRSHFFAIAARAMRQILVDHARARLTQKRGAGAAKLCLDEAASLAVTPHPDLLDLDRALDKLGTVDPRKARVVELIYFGGMSAGEAAEALGVTRRTIERDWQFARIWLYRELSAADRQGTSDGEPAS